MNTHRVLTLPHAVRAEEAFMPSRSLANPDARASRRCDAPPQPKQAFIHFIISRY
jgi:hypothetical protein